MALEQLQERLNFIFYASDFKTRNDAKSYWTREFKQAKKINNLQELKKWALTNLEYLDDFSCDYIKEEVEKILNDIIYYAVKEVVEKLNKDFSNVSFKEDYHLNDEDTNNKYVIVYNNTIVGSELVSYEFIKGYISCLLRA